MNDKDWQNKCTTNYEAEAKRLEADGFERQEVGKLIPAVFVKDGKVIYLARKLGSSTWYPVIAPGQITWLEE